MQNHPKGQEFFHTVCGNPHDTGAGSEVYCIFRVFFQIVDDFPAGVFLNFQTADINAVDGICVDVFQIAFMEGVFNAVVDDKTPFAVPFILHKAVTAAIFFLRFPYINGHAPFFQLFIDKIPVHAAAHSSTKAIRRAEMPQDIADQISAAPQRTALSADVDILAAFGQMFHSDNDVHHGGADD